METSLSRRKSIRLEGYDYSQPGMYFVTVCVQGKKHLLGEIEMAKMHLSELGRKVWETWEELPKRYRNIELDEGVVMPNHFHGIIVIKNVGAPLAGARSERAGARPAPTLGSVIGAFKSMTARQFLLSSKKNPSQLWQRNYYERVIRNEKELFETRQYIQQNPLKWELDPENPAFNATTVGAPLVGARG